MFAAAVAALILTAAPTLQMPGQKPEPAPTQTKAQQPEDLAAKARAELTPRLEDMVKKMTAAEQAACQQAKEKDCEKIGYSLKALYIASVNKPGELAIAVLEPKLGPVFAFLFVKDGEGTWHLVPEDFR